MHLHASNILHQENCSTNFTHMFYQKYVQKQQFVEPEDPSLDKKKTKFIQEITGTFLFYVHAINSTMLMTLSSIDNEQAKPTKNPLKKILRFLNYATTNPDAIITYPASNMILAAHSNAFYLSEPKARSRAGGHFFMSTNSAFHPYVTLHKSLNTTCLPL